MPRYTERDVREAVASAQSLAEALRTLGLRPAGGNHRTLHRLIAKYGISIDHLDHRWAMRRQRRSVATALSEILVEHSTYSRGHLKDRLFAEGVKQRTCELCGLGDEWRGQPMSLILDHINGVPTDNRIENLRIVCPNCAATLETHCGRKKRIDREPRACLHCSGEFFPKYPLLLAAMRKPQQGLARATAAAAQGPAPVLRAASGRRRGDELRRRRPQVRDPLSGLPGYAELSLRIRAGSGNLDPAGSDNPSASKAALSRHRLHRSLP